MRLNPILAEMKPYPFLALDEARRRALAAGRSLIDFSVGDPHEATDPVIRRALVDSLEERSSYPKAEGLPELKEAIADWCERRYGARPDPTTEVMPTLGSKEAVFSLAQVAMDPRSEKNLVVAAKRELFLEFLQHKRVRVAGAEATFYLWCQVPDGESSEEFAARLLEQGVVIAPGSYFGDAGEGYFRVALVPTLAECQQAVEILDGVL